MSTLRVGSAGPEVQAAQQALAALAYQLDVDGLFGPKTRDVVGAFQRSRGLDVDGIIGAATWAALLPSRHEVQRVRTPLSPVELVGALQEGHQRAFGSAPSSARLKCGWAQVALENTKGADIWNDNLANISAFGWPGDYYVLHVKERTHRDPDIWRQVDMRFRNHGTPAEGAEDYWRLMAGRFAPALACFDRGDLACGAQQLSRLIFYTALESDYERGLLAIAREFPG